LTGADFSSSIRRFFRHRSERGRHFIYDRFRLLDEVPLRDPLL